MRLIDAETMDFAWIKEVLKSYIDKLDYDIFQYISETQTVYAKPIVYAKWEWETEDIWRCSACNHRTNVDEVMEEPVYNYCPYCGARMELED